MVVLQVTHAFDLLCPTMSAMQLGSDYYKSSHLGLPMLCHACCCSAPTSGNQSSRRPGCSVKALRVGAIAMQAQKVYVQDRLRDSGKLVWELLEAGGHFYVCGDAAQMAGAVEQELLQIIESHQVSGEQTTRHLCSIAWSCTMSKTYTFVPPAIGIDVGTQITLLSMVCL